MAGKESKISRELERLQARQAINAQRIQALEELYDGRIPQRQVVFDPIEHTREVLAAAETLPETRETNTANLNLAIAREVVAYEQFFESLALEGHAKEAYKRRGLLPNRFKLEAEIDGTPYELKHRTENDCDDVIFIPESYDQKIPGVVSGKLTIGFDDGKINSVGISQVAGLDPLQSFNENAALKDWRNFGSIKGELMFAKNLLFALPEAENHRHELTLIGGHGFKKATYAFQPDNNDFTYKNFTKDIAISASQREDIASFQIDATIYTELLKSTLRLIPAKAVTKQDA